MEEVEIRIKVDKFLAEWLEALAEETGWRPEEVAQSIIGPVLWKLYYVWKLGERWAERRSERPHREESSTEAKARAPQTS